MFRMPTTVPEHDNVKSKPAPDVPLSPVAELQDVVTRVMERRLRPPCHVISAPVFAAMRKHAEVAVRALGLKELYPVHRPLFTELMDAPMANVLSVLQPFLLTRNGPDDCVPLESTGPLKAWMQKLQSRINFALDIGDMPNISVSKAAKRHCQFKETYTRLTGEVNQALRKYNSVAFAKADASVPCDCDYCSSGDEADMLADAQAAEHTDQCAVVLEVAEQLDDECAPWYECPEILDAVFTALFSIAKAFMNYASLVYHCRDICTFSRYEQYTLLAHIVLQLQFTSLADYILNMPCFTFCQQDLLLIALVAGVHTPRPTLFQSLCCRGLLPVDLVIGGTPHKLRTKFQHPSRLNKSEYADYETCVAYAARIRGSRSFSTLSETIHDVFRETARAVNATATASAVKIKLRDDTIDKLWPRLENEPGAFAYRYKYVIRERMQALQKTDCLDTDALDKYRATLHGLTFATAVTDAVSTPLFVVGSVDRLEQHKLDFTSLKSLYRTGQLAGAHKRDRMQPKKISEQPLMGFCNFVCMDHSAEVDPCTRANAMRQFYCGWV